jgi:hypothetical protein
MEGQAWTPPTAPAPPARNAFTARLTGARAVTLDTRRMRLDPRRDIEGDVTTDAPVRLTITGVGTYDLAAGHHTLVVRRAGRARRG